MTKEGRVLVQLIALAAKAADSLQAINEGRLASVVGAIHLISSRRLRPKLGYLFINRALKVFEFNSGLGGGDDLELSGQLTPVVEGRDILRDLFLVNQRPVEARTLAASEDIGELV